MNNNNSNKKRDHSSDGDALQSQPKQQRGSNLASDQMISETSTSQCSMTASSSTDANVFVPFSAHELSPGANEACSSSQSDIVSLPGPEITQVTQTSQFAQIAQTSDDKKTLLPFDPAIPTHFEQSTFCFQNGAPPLSVTTIMLASHMGTGKTVFIVNRIKALSKEFPEIRICVLTSRIELANELHLLLDDKCNEQNFKHYKTHRKDIASAPCLVIQMESLFKIEKNENPFNLVVIDEVESALDRFPSVKTMGRNLIRNARVFQRIIESADHVIAADAFLSQPTILLFRELRNSPLSYPTHPNDHPFLYPRPLVAINNGDPSFIVVQNTTLPKPRQAIRVKDWDSLEAILLRSVREGGKKVFLACACLDKANALANKLEQLGIQHRFYHSNNHITGRANDEWNALEIRVVLWTPAITVGIDFNHDGIFHEGYVYGSVMSCPVYEMMQSAHRVRHLIDNRLYYAFQLYSGKVARYFESIGRRQFNDIVQRIPTQARIDWVKNEYWLDDVIVNAILRQNMSRCHYRDIFESYLKYLNYNITDHIVSMLPNG